MTVDRGQMLSRAELIAGGAHMMFVSAAQVDLPYHVRVLVPCYKEDLAIVRRTVMAAYDALLPAGCARTIYLCDDGKDPKKHAFCEALGPEVHCSPCACPKWSSKQLLAAVVQLYRLTTRSCNLTCTVPDRVESTGC